MTERPPAMAGDWRITALVATAVAAPLLLVLQIDDVTHSSTNEVAISGLVGYLMLLAAAISVYFIWRITRDGATGWMAAAMCLSGIQGVGLQLRTLADPASAVYGAAWQIVVHITLVAAVVLLALAAGRREVVVDPMAVGVLGGVVCILARWALIEQAPALALHEAADVGFRLVVGLGCAGLVAAVAAVPTLPRWVRARMAGVVALLSIAYQMTFPVPEGTARGAIAFATHLAGGVLAGSTAFAMHRAVLNEERSDRTELRQQLVRLESLARLDRARLHEVGATIAGIHSASNLLDSHLDLPASTRATLTAMVREETARLGRLLATRAPAIPNVVSVDRAIGPVVERQVAAGQRVTWSPSGRSVWARGDELAEVVSILLDNAAKHAAGASVEIGVHDTGTRVEITVTDAGPGLAPHQVERAFDWGWSGTPSGGQGIGLAIARQLLADVGGRLRYEDADPGARFVVELRRVTPGAGAPEE